MKGFPYFWGIATTKCIRAILFIFWPGRNRDRSILDACSGWIRHMVRFYESREYSFELNVQLSKGDAEVVLLDSKRRQLLKLNREFPSQTIELDGRGIYYLRWKFNDASGKCELRW